MTNNISKTLGSLTLTLAAIGCSTLPAQAVNFNFTYGLGVTQQQKEATELAGNIWSDHLADPVTVNIHVEMINNSQLPTNVIGGAIPFFKINHNYSDFYNKLQLDKTSTDDDNAVASLDSGVQWTAWDSNSFDQFDQINMTRANAKAIGAISGNDSTLDALIVMNNLNGTGTNWQYDYLSSGVGSNQLDFTSVMIHEIGHSLGFVSTVDSYTYAEYLDDGNDVDNTPGSNQGGTNGETDKFKDHWTTMDMFRYYTAQDGTKQRGLWYGTDGTGWNQYLSIDGGTNSLAVLESGADTRINGASGFQASHYLNTLNAGIMDPVLELDTRRYLDPNGIDLRFFDAIGWDRTSETTQLSTLQNSAISNATTRGNINRDNELGDMFVQNTWGSASTGSTGSTYTQQGTLVESLYQAGFFEVGLFQQKFDFDAHSSAASVPEPTSTVALLGLGLVGFVCGRKRNSQLQ